MSSNAASLIVAAGTYLSEMGDETRGGRLSAIQHNRAGFGGSDPGSDGCGDLGTLPVVTCQELFLRSSCDVLSYKVRLGCTSFQLTLRVTRRHHPTFRRVPLLT